MPSRLSSAASADAVNKVAFAAAILARSNRVRDVAMIFLLRAPDAIRISPIVQVWESPMCEAFHIRAILRAGPTALWRLRPVGCVE